MTYFSLAASQVRQHVWLVVYGGADPLRCAGQQCQAGNGATSAVCALSCSKVRPCNLLYVVFHNATQIAAMVVIL